MVIVGVVGIIGVGFARNDILSVGTNEHSKAALINRALTSLVIGGSTIVIARTKSGKTFDLAIITILVAMVLSTTHLLSEWQPDHVAYLPVNLVLVTVQMQSQRFASERRKTPDH